MSPFKWLWFPRLSYVQCWSALHLQNVNMPFHDKSGFTQPLCLANMRKYWSIWFVTRVFSQTFKLLFRCFYFKGHNQQGHSLIGLLWTNDTAKWLVYGLRCEHKLMKGIKECRKKFFKINVFSHAIQAVKETCLVARKLSFAPLNAARVMMLDVLNFITSNLFTITCTMTKALLFLPVRFHIIYCNDPDQILQ